MKVLSFELKVVVINEKKNYRFFVRKFLFQKGTASLLSKAATINYVFHHANKHFLNHCLLLLVTVNFNNYIFTNFIYLSLEARRKRAKKKKKIAAVFRRKKRSYQEQFNFKLSENRKQLNT